MTKAPGTTPFTRPKGRSVIHRQQRPHFTPALAAASGCFPGPFLPLIHWLLLRHQFCHLLGQIESWTLVHYLAVTPHQP